MTRNTTATILMVLGVPPRAIMEIMGWSQLSMLARYQPRVEGHLWSD